MAAITPVAGPQGSLTVLRNATAQANVGQVDWVHVPSWAKFAIVTFNLTSVGASTTPLADLTLYQTDPLTLNDTYKQALHAAFTQITAAAQLVVNIGPGITGIADDVTTAATGNSEAFLNRPLPALLGVGLVFDRTTGDEVYTYTLSIQWKK